MHRTIAAAGTVGLAALLVTPVTAAQAQEQGEATVSVLHGVPGLTVDVYANGEELIPDFEPGTLTDPLSLPAGTYDLQVFADGDTASRSPPGQTPPSSPTSTPTATPPSPRSSTTPPRPTPATRA
jgi:hypothetical protein